MKSIDLTSSTLIRSSEFLKVDKRQILVRAFDKNFFSD